MHFPGWIKAPEIYGLMKNSHVGLAPYAKDAKMTLPNKPFEYMAGGLPIVSSLTGDMRKLINEFEFGMSYQADSVSELTAALKALKENMGARETMAANSRQVLENRFSTEIVFEKTLDFITGPALSH